MLTVKGDPARREEKYVLSPRDMTCCRLAQRKIVVSQQQCCDEVQGYFIGKPVAIADLTLTLPSP